MKSLQELKQKAAVSEETHWSRQVTIFIRSVYFELNGHWSWDLQTDTIFCGDVFLMPPAGFIGTSGIIHPDDVQELKEKLFNPDHTGSQLQFRIITSYGEIRELSGEQLRIEKKETIAPDNIQLAFEHWQQQREFEKLLLVKEMLDQEEKDTETGSWYYNTTTGEAWYSNQVFRLHHLPPQSLNAHLNTFISFIHPEDKPIVVSFIDRSVRSQTPLQMEYRIQTVRGEKNILHRIHWVFSHLGEPVLCGTLQDVTEQKLLEQKAEGEEDQAAFHRQQVWGDEQLANLGHWQVNLLTRKTHYSDNLYRIYGLKPQSVPAGVNTFLNFIHPEDRGLVAAAHKRMLLEHALPELQFRIIRSDGKVRFLNQKARLISLQNELVMSGTVQDMTVQKMLERKLEEQTRKEAIRSFIQQQAEDMAMMGSWVMDLQTNVITWHDSLYRLFGFKPNAVELTLKRLLLFLHPEDQKRFSEEWTLMQNGKEQTEFGFRVVQRGKILFMNARFRLMQHGGSNLFIGTMRNITEEHNLHREVVQRMQLAEALSENILDRVLITDTSNNIIFWNRQCEQVYGRTSEDAIGKNFFDVFPHLKTEDELQLFKKVNGGETVCRTGNRSVLNADYFDVYLVPMWDENHTEIIGIIHIVHDVTREMELRIRLSERLNFIEHLVDSSVDRVIALDRNMNYLYWNRTAEDYYGLKKEAVVGKNILELFPSFINDPSYPEFREVLKGRTVHLRPDADKNRNNYFETYLIPIKNETEEVIGILWMVHDLTKEFLLKKEQERAGQILDTIKEVYIELDEEYRFIYVNRMAEEFWKQERKDLLGKNFWDLFPATAGMKTYQIITTAMKEKTPQACEYFSPVLDRRIYMSATPSDAGVVVLFYDMEENKETGMA